MRDVMSSVPSDAELDQTTLLLRRSIQLHGVLVLCVLFAALLGAANVVNGVFDALRSLLLPVYPGSADAATAVVILASLVNMSLTLVLIVAVRARELWVLFGLALLIVANAAALAVWGYIPSLITIALGGWTFVRLIRSKMLRSNPVMIRELRGRMRGARAFVVMTIYLALMGGFALLLYLIFGSINAQNASAATGQVGRILFAGVVGIELLLIIFIAPSLTAGAITGERERQTYDLVRTTQLTTPSFVFGKLESSLGYIFLLLLAAVPLQALAFLFGGISEIELLLSFTILVVTAVTFGTVGIYFSASQARTMTANVRTYASIGIGAFLIPLGLGIVGSIVEDALFGSAAAVNAPGVEAVLQYTRLLVSSLNPFIAALETQQLLVGSQIAGFYTVTLASNGSTIPMVAPWVTFSIVYLAVASILITLTVRQMRTLDHLAQ